MLISGVGEISFPDVPIAPHDAAWEVGSLTFPFPAGVARRLHLFLRLHHVSSGVSSGEQMVLHHMVYSGSGYNRLPKDMGRL